MSYAGPVTFGAPMRPYQGSFWGTPLPANAAIDPNSAAIVAEIARQATLAPPHVNGPDATPRWSAEPQIVPASQPLVPVTWAASWTDSRLQAVAGAGLPIVPGWHPTGDSDATGIWWQPDYVNPHDPTICGRYFEGYGMAVTVDDMGVEHWSVRNIFRAQSVNIDTVGHPRNWTSGYGGANPGDPDSTYQLAGWGTQGSGLPYMPGLISLTDARRGSIDHAVQLSVAQAGVGRHWPAQKDDGATASCPVLEGMRGRLAPGYFVGNVHPVCSMLVAAVSRYGFVITDKTASNLAFRAAPSVASVFGSSSSSWLTGFPWTHLQILAEGSDSNPTPTS